MKRPIGRQVGAGALTLIGSLLIVAGLAGLGFAWMTPATPPPPPVFTSVAPASNAPPAPTAPTTPPVVALTAPAPVVTPVPTAGPHPNWHGSWQGETPGSRLVIGPAGVDRTYIRENDGKKRTHTEHCKWTLPAAKSGEGCHSGYAKSSKAVTAIQAEYEQSAEAFRRDPTDFHISDPVRSRAALRSVSPGNYRILWTEDEGDCSRNEMIIDNDTVLSDMQCHYGHEVERFTRIR